MLTPERDRHADTIIRNHAIFSTASGAIPVAFADIAAVSAVQLDMIRQLCEVYGVDFQLTRGKALVTAITSAAIARVGAASLVKLVPIAGTVVGSLSGAAMAGASSYALGQAFKTHLSTGGTFLDLDPERLKRIYREQFEKGKEQVRTWRDEASAAESSDAESPGRSFFDFGRANRPGPNAPADAASSETSSAWPQSDAGRNGTKPTASPPARSEDPDVVSVKPSSAPQDGPSISVRLRALGKLLEEGLISQQEYTEKRQQMLGSL